MTTQNRFLRIKSVLEMVGGSRAYVYREMQAGRFPRPVKMGPKFSAWVESEVAAWVEAQIAKRDGVEPKRQKIAAG
jgi:prophage regulatory protein